MITDNREIANEIKLYYEKRMTYTISEEIIKKLNEAAKQIADEIMSKYEVKQVLYDRFNENTSGPEHKGEIIITTILTPKEVVHNS